MRFEDEIREKLKVTWEPYAIIVGFIMLITGAVMFVRILSTVKT